jgi:hypothetical protein
MTTLPTLPRKKAVPMEVKKSVMDCIVAHIDGHHNDLSNGWFTLQSEKHISSHQQLSKACGSKSVAEVILT